MENNDAKLCPICNAELKEEDAIIVCPACGAAHHQKCWDENHGCGAPECSERRSEPAEPAEAAGATVKVETEAAETIEATVQQPDLNKPAVCPKCGTELREAHGFCPKCGQKISEPADGGKKKPSKKNTTIIIAAAAALVVIIGIFVISSTMLFGDDKTAYDLIIAESDRFKDPTSIELVSGSLSETKSLLYAGISATNSFGARNTSYYLISSTSITETKYPTSKYTDKEALNIKKINKALDRKLKK